jgi:hypothetical protein
LFRLATSARLQAFVPALVAALAVLLVAAIGFTQRSFFGTALEDYFHGFFFRSYPLFLFAVIYGAVRIVTAAVTEPGARRSLRTFSTPLALLLFLAASFYPTFGGIILRPGYMTGGMSFLRGQNATVAVVLGAGAAALAYGVALGLAVLIARLSFRFQWRGIGRLLLRFGALWLGALMLLAPGQLGFDVVGVWPAGPLVPSRAWAAACVVGLALLPHALSVAWTRPAV